ncbi:MAG: O-acetyl-ADP-ribose deacetylase [Bacteroidales bacterium]
MHKKIELIKADITTLHVDAIVNAANESLLGGGGVDGAIHRAAGPKLLDECKLIGRCPTGEARITKGYNLKAKYVIHTVGPIWRGGKNDEPSLLKNAYASSLKLAQENTLKSVAFPNISTGVYGFPKKLAAETAVKTVKLFMEENEYPQRVVFVCFDDESYSIYSKLMDVPQ